MKASLNLKASIYLEKSPICPHSSVSPKDIQRKSGVIIFK